MSVRGEQRSSVDAACCVGKEQANSFTLFAASQLRSSTALAYSPGPRSALMIMMITHTHRGVSQSREEQASKQEQALTTRVTIERWRCEGACST